MTFGVLCRKFWDWVEEGEFVILPLEETVRQYRREKRLTASDEEDEDWSDVGSKRRKINSGDSGREPDDEDGMLLQAAYELAFQVEGIVSEENAEDEEFHTPAPAQFNNLSSDEDSGDDFAIKLEETSDSDVGTQQGLVADGVEDRVFRNVEITLGYRSKDGIEHVYDHIVSAEDVRIANKEPDFRIDVPLRRLNGQKVRPIAYQGIVRGKSWSRSPGCWRYMASEEKRDKARQISMAIFMLETTAGVVRPAWAECNACAARGLHCVTWSAQAQQVIARPGSACAHCRIDTRCCSLATRARNGTRNV